MIVEWIKYDDRQLLVERICLSIAQYNVLEGYYSLSLICLPLLRLDYGKKRTF